ncbi:histidine phosphatase family protein [Litoreibacter roseus]|uniref:Phosphoglycerate mutase n=1 Tax=Litoreibacter roseus TaxID=2601869 RepID=A0A6N6JBU3_9RHOB|nr:histidine phosphatase family protein [Litoreibacter roseus]GFE63320.1 phosphoglycerate mutase [Litoreibacter roseus]
MTRWWWVRHGPTHEKAFCGWRDVPADLSDEDTILRLNAYLPSQAVIVSSDLRRAVQTADALEKGRTRLDHLQAFREFHFGDWDGLTFDDVSRRDPELSRAYWEDPGEIKAPNGESWYDAARRIEPEVDRMNESYAGQNIIAVAHFGAILTQVGRAGGLPPYDCLGHGIDNLSVTEMSWDGHQWHLGKINHVP